jgi:tetratricopeptide (TPR) repeat protein
LAAFRHEKTSMTIRRARRWLAGLAMAQALTATAADTAGAPQATCVPAFSVTDVEHGFRFDRDCGLPVGQLTRLTADVDRAARRVQLPGSQRVALAKAANVMFQAAPAQAFERVGALVVVLASQGGGRADLDFAALARNWSARYALLRRLTRVAWTDDPLEAQIDAAIAALDLDTAAALLVEAFSEPGAPDALTAARCFTAGVVEWLRLSPKRALTFLRIAHALQPNDVDIAEFYSDLLEEGHQLEQAQPIVEALALRYQVLAQAKPDRWQPRLARALARMGRLYAVLALPQDAEMADLHALGVYWGLAREQPDRYGPAVAQVLEALATLYRDAERPSDAIDAYREALKLERALAKHDANAYSADLARTLNDLGVLYASAHRRDEAQNAYAEALDLQRALVRENALAHRAALARTLNNLGNLYSDGGQFADAEQAYGEALAIRRLLARESPRHDAPDMARTLTNLGVLYRKEGRPSQAEHAYRESLRTLQVLQRGAPGTLRADEARTLNNLGVLLSKTRRRDEAQDAFRRAVALYGALDKKDPASYRADYARVLGNLAKLYAEMGKVREARAVQEAAGKLKDAVQAQ